MDINSKQMAQQQLAGRKDQPQPTFNQPGPNVTPNATMATSGVTPIIGGMNTQTKSATPFSIGADPFERMQDLKDMSDNQIYVGMQQGVITPVEGLITMQTRNEARRRHREQELAKQAGKKSVIEQVTEEFVSNSGIASNPQMQEEKPVIAKKEGGVINYQNRGLVGPYRRELDPQFIPPTDPSSYGRSPYGDRRPGYMIGDNKGRRIGYVPAGTPDEQRKAEAMLRSNPFSQPQNMADPRNLGLGSQENYIDRDILPVGGEGILSPETIQTERAKRKYGEYIGGERRLLDSTDATRPLTRDQLVKMVEESGVDVRNIPATRELSVQDLITKLDDSGVDVIRDGIQAPPMKQSALQKDYTNRATEIFKSAGADDRTVNTMLGILNNESGFDYEVLVGEKPGLSGELGAFQVRPEFFGKGKDPGYFAKGDYSTKQLKDFSTNANIALDYFTGMKKYFGDKYDDLGIDPHEVAIAAYNTGPGNVEKILKDKDIAEAIKGGANFVDYLPNDVRDYVFKALSRERQAELEKETAEFQAGRKEQPVKPSALDSQYTGQKVVEPTEEITEEIKDEEEVVPETRTGMDLLATSKDSFDEKQFRDRFDNALNRGIKKNIPGDAENLVDILDKSVSPDSVKQIVKELYPGNAVKEADKIVNDAIKDVLKTKEDMEQHYKGMRFIKMAQAVIAPGQRLDQALINMVGVGAAEKEKFIKAQQAYNDKMTKLRSAKAQIMSADEATKGKISGEIYSSYMKANSEAKKAYIDAMAKRAELAEKRIENKIKLVGNKDFMGVMENNFKELEKAIQRKYPSMREDSPEYLTRINTLRNTLLNASTEAFMQGENFDPTPIYMQILGDEQEARRLAVESEKLTAAAREALVAKLPSAKEFADYTSTGLEFLKNFINPEASQFFEDLKKDLSNFEEFKKKNR